MEAAEDTEGTEALTPVNLIPTAVTSVVSSAACLESLPRGSGLASLRRRA